MRNASVKTHQITLLICLWQLWRFLCHIHAYTADILDRHPRNISDQNTHCKPEPSIARSSAVHEAGMGTQVRIAVAQLRMK